MYLARATTQLGEKTAAENSWLRALDAAHGNPGKLMSVAAYAEKNGMIAVADQAYATTIAEAPKLRAAHQARLRLAQGERDTRKMNETLRVMLEHWPNDPAVQNDEAYTRLLLLGANREESEAGSRESAESAAEAASPTTNNQQPITNNSAVRRHPPNFNLPSSISRRGLLAVATSTTNNG